MAHHLLAVTVLHIYHFLRRVCLAIFYPSLSKIDPSTVAEPDIERGYHQVSRKLFSPDLYISLTAGMTDATRVLDISSPKPIQEIPSSPKPKQIHHRRRRSTRWFPNILKNRATQTDIVALVRQAFEDCHDDEYEARAVFDRQSAWGTIKSLVIHDEFYDESYENVPTTPTWTEALPPYTHSTPPSSAFAKLGSFYTPFPCTSSAPSTIVSLSSCDTTQSLPALLYQASMPCLPLSFSAPSLAYFQVDARMSTLMESHDGLDVPEEIDADWSDVLSLDAYVV
ncbi:hypothetical protein CPB85DRAFT_1286217 [Mucidula mucida]|nr:hypothetical protein CPB85DRAFT_1286217 [Mucidula mucida]